MNRVFTTTAIAIAAVAICEPAFAQAVGGIGAVASSLTENLKTIPTLLGTAFQGVGIWFAGSAAFKLKQLGEDGHNRELASKALVHGIAGVLMVALPVALGVGMNTLFSSTGNNLTATNGVISIK
jgi:hypothetical protein